MSGRPKKKRIREASEAPSSGSQLTRKGRVMKCSNCKGEGHNKSSCTNKNTPTEEIPRANPRRRGARQGRSTRGGGRGRQQSGFGVYYNHNTSETLLDPGQPSETVLNG
ncbi:unnamed protein product [Cuscuta europaea]|uniref:Uncharacterized protein n=1 Tax=Cuscuta europaea TaxID=41803 RepID=A0A9P0YIR8_CUSEU|nr:unnamed protein product [Cuscuta europaea]